MRDEVERMSRYVRPLTAIADLTVTKKRAINSDNMNELPENIQPLSQEEKHAELEKLSPELVLQNLADFCNEQTLSN